MNVETMDPAMKAKWVAALRSGEFKQCNGNWERVLDSGEHQYCCVTVLFKVAGLSTDQQSPREVAAQLGIPDSFTPSEVASPIGSLQHFIDMNDKHKFTFVEIADHIETPGPLPIPAAPAVADRIAA